jgi:hypothetical protein
VNPVVEALLDLVVDLPAKAGQAAKGGLDVAAGAAEPVIEIEMPERGVEVVAPHQADHAAAEPDTFRVAGRAIEDLLRLDEFVGLALIVLGRIGGVCGGSLSLSVLALIAVVTALGKNAGGTDQDGEAGNGEAEQNRILDQKQPSAHKFPDLLRSLRQPGRAGLMPFNWDPNAAETPADSHDGHFEFCPANSQLYRVVVKPGRAKARDCVYPALGRLLFGYLFRQLLA